MKYCSASLGSKNELFYCSDYCKNYSENRLSDFLEGNLTDMMSFFHYFKNLRYRSLKNPSNNLFIDRLTKAEEIINRFARQAIENDGILYSGANENEYSLYHY